MANNYYNHGAYPATGAPGRSADLRAELNTITAGFDKLPAITGNAFKIAYVNAGETGWDTLGGTGLLKLRAAAVPVIATDGTDYVSPAGAATLTNKIIVVASNTITTAAHGTLAATELNAALAELADDDAFIATALANHLADATDAHAASAITNTPAGGIAATTVQAAINELDTEKAPLASPALTGNPTAPTPAVNDNDTSIATTAFVRNEFGNGFGGGGFDFKNAIINGDMLVIQRGGTFTSVADGTYTLDRWRYVKSGAMVHDVVLDNAPPSVASAGRLFTNNLRLTLTTADNAIAAGDFAGLHQKIEGYVWRNLAQRAFTLSFWVFATLPGTYCVAFRNGGADRTYVAEYTINVGSTWEFKTITVSASPSAGTWDYTNGIGVFVEWCLAAGTTFHTTANAWNVGSFRSTVNQVNGVATGSTFFSIVGVRMEPGSVATPSEPRPFQTELALCQRYYEKSFDHLTPPAQNTGASNGLVEYRVSSAGAVNQTIMVGYKVYKRAGSPTITFYNPNAANANWRNATDGADSGAGTLEVSGERSFVIRCPQVATDNVGDELRIHWTSDAEL